jgi:glycosyltransferase involved in cell wall biosynthesis
MPEANPAVSIITVSYNARDTIERTIAGVLDQTYPRIEYVLVDGASTDGTADIVRAYGSRVAAWVSEPDGGIADAMNKGLHMSSGELVLFLHADDYLRDDRAIASAVEAMAGTGADVYAFDILFGNAENPSRRRPRGFGWHMYFKTGIFHQAAFCRRSLFEKIGGFDTRFRIAMDYDFFLRAYRAGATLKRIPAAFSVMRDTGVSSRRDWASLRERFREEQAVQARASPGRAMHAVYLAYWPTYLAYRRVRATLAGG